MQFFNLENCVLRYKYMIHKIKSHIIVEEKYILLLIVS